MTLSDPMDGSPPGSRPWDSPGKNTGALEGLMLKLKLQYFGHMM